MGSSGLEAQLSPTTFCTFVREFSFIEAAQLGYRGERL